MKMVNPLSVENLDHELLVFCKLYILLFADDTVLFVELQEDLQQSINLVERFCSIATYHKRVKNYDYCFLSWARGKKRKYLHSLFRENELEVVGQYKYMGPIFNYNRQFRVAKKQLVVKGNRAMFL